MESKIKHFLYCPFTGLGLYGGFRGNRWLKNRLRIFKQFVLPSLLAQSSKEFTLWVSWRPEEKYNKYVKEFVEFMDGVKEFKTVHTFHGVCFWDDKYSDEEARDRLLTNLHDTMGELVGHVGDVSHVLMTIQPSDDCYSSVAVAGIQACFNETPDMDAFGFSKGYICNYLTKEVAEYNPTTNPPFYTIKFTKAAFINPLEHANHTSLKKDAGKYKKGTPLPSHEYVKDCLRYGVIQEREFLVGTHRENISTVFTHPFKGSMVDKNILARFGIHEAPELVLKTSWRRAVLHKLPFKVQRKLRYWLGERIWNNLYNFLRS